MGNWKNIRGIFQELKIIMSQYIKDYNVAILIVLKIFNKKCFKLIFAWRYAQYRNYLYARIKNISVLFTKCNVYILFLKLIHLFIQYWNKLTIGREWKFFNIRENGTG